MQTLADLLFPNVTKTPADMEAQYPPRNLPEGAKVTRFAPSPTGFVHFGGMFPVTVGERLAHQSGGVFYLRIEDTDAKREVPGAAEGLINTLSRYGIRFDEGAILGEDGKVSDHGIYGPYKQSARGPIYHVYAKELVRRGRAYPVFTTKEELEELNAVDKKAEIKAKDWHEDNGEARRAAQLAARAITLDEVRANIEAGNPFVLRIIGDGDPDKKTPFTDLVRGKLEMPENDEDFVLLKSDGIPTYHFAHAVDDHLMGTTHVIRGEEWLPSLPKHLQLFHELGFRLPKYLHISQLMKLDENGAKKKLSKRDMGANMDDYERLGYAPACVMEYVMTLLNSNYEEWHRASPDAPYTDFPFNMKKMCVSGCLFDTAKLNDVSKNVLSRLTADEMYELLTAWTVIYDEEFHALLTRDPDYAKRILAIGRGGKKPRKDFAVYTDVRPYMAFFYDELFSYEDGVKEQILASFPKEDVKAAIDAFSASYDPADDMNAWFEKVKTVAESLGYTSDMKAYKASPESFKGNVADVSMFLRVAITGKQNAPDLYAVMQILGEARAKARLAAFASAL
ncbi:MAG: glutamate--tRNA ligase [Clostridia bacterium]|nr:glutamate--tRNA ligase [Clostridia bacterium]